MLTLTRTRTRTSPLTPPHQHPLTQAPDGGHAVWMCSMDKPKEWRNSLVGLPCLLANMNSDKPKVEA